MGLYLLFSTTSISEHSGSRRCIWLHLALSVFRGRRKGETRRLSSHLAGLGLTMSHEITVSDHVYLGLQTGTPATWVFDVTTKYRVKFVFPSKPEPSHCGGRANNLRRMTFDGAPDYRAVNNVICGERFQPRTSYQCHKRV